MLNLQSLRRYLDMDAIGKIVRVSRRRRKGSNRVMGVSYNMGDCDLSDGVGRLPKKIVVKIDVRGSRGNR